MQLHIKPGAPKDAVFRFKSNFIRYYRDFDTCNLPLSAGLCDGIEESESGIMESAASMEVEVLAIKERHTKACAEEIKALLRRAAQELNIPLT